MNVHPVIVLAILGLAGAQQASICKKPSGQYEVVNPNSCSTFFRCNGHEATEIPCRDGKLFDSNSLICLPPSVAVCSANNIPNFIRDLCWTLSKNKFVPGIECSKYYECNGSNATALSCPNGQHFSRAHAACTNPLIAGCKSLDGMCSGEYQGFSFASLTCNEYYECNRQLKPTLKKCDKELHFSFDQQKCTDPALSGCSNDGGTNPGGSCVDPPVPECDSSNSGTFFPHKNPDWFYMCYNSQPLEMQCESGLTYDTLLKYCVKDGAHRVC